MKSATKVKTAKGRRSRKRMSLPKGARTKSYLSSAMKKTVTSLKKKDYPSIAEILVGEKAFKVIMNREAADLERFFREHKKSGGLTKVPTKLSDQGRLRGKKVKRGVVLKSLSSNSGLMKFELVADEDKRTLVRK